MICALTRWLISRSRDTGKKMPGFAARHATRCEACRAYARFAESLPSRFSRELPSVLADTPDVSPQEIPWKSVEARPAAPPRIRVLRFLRPLPVAALVAVVLAGFFVFRQIAGGPGPAPEETLAGLKSLIAVSGDLPSAAARAESPLVREQAFLEKSVLSAYEYLQARLNIKIERKDTRAT